MKSKEISLIVFGASGFIGREVCRYFSSKEGYRVVAVKRKSPISFKGKTVALNSPELDRILSTSNVILNLSGANIGDQAWTSSRKKELRESRTMVTHNIKQKWVHALIGAEGKEDNSKPKQRLFLNASAVGYYNQDGENIGAEDDIKTENSEKGSGFLSDLTSEWEQASQLTNEEEKKLTEAGIDFRSVQLRFGLVLGRDGGALPKVLQTTKWFMGAVLGSGEQLISWISLLEIPPIIEFLIQHPKVVGPVNITAPQSITFRQFTYEVGKYLRRPILFKIPELFLKKTLGERSKLLLQGDRVYPEKLLEAGYVFDYPNLPLALESLYMTERISK